jgi:fatty acid desaturase
MADGNDRRPTGLLEARQIVADLFVPKPAVYWPDFLLSALIGWSAFFGAVRFPLWGLGGICFLVASLALYRAALFIHELTHLKPGSLPGFRIVWNLLLGIPMLVPSYLYEGVHVDHHRRTLYGTSLDPEYRPLARGSRAGIVLFLIEPLVAPILLFLRHLLLAPLSWFLPPLRRLLVARASGLVINPHYVRAPLTKKDARSMLAMEIACFVLWGTLVTLVALGWISIRWPLTWGGVAATVLFVNQVRTLGAHRYRGGGEQLDVVVQLLDSVNVEGGLLTELWAPVGLRFHGLHHYLPDLPYTRWEPLIEG